MYVSFIDAYSRFTCLYLLKHKYDVLRAPPEFSGIRRMAILGAIPASVELEISMPASNLSSLVHREPASRFVRWFSPTGG
jgi:hypothetical protein